MCTSLCAQQEASVWYFGQNAGLKFEQDGTVIPLSDGLLSTHEGCSSIADAQGNLLFYTDGRTVWDRNHVIMPNGNYAAGTGLYGDPSSTQSGIIVPKPGDPNIYYIFTVDEPHHENALVYPAAFSGSYSVSGDGSTPQDDDGRNWGLNYSIVDLSIVGSNGSIGEITIRNSHLITYNTDPAGNEIKYKCSEKITAVKNESANEYWVITHFIDKFIAFNITASGVSSTAVISQIGPSIILEGYRRNSIGYLKTSPDGDKLAVAHQENGNVSGQNSLNTGKVILYDFDKLTGEVSNENILLQDVHTYGVEFSALSTKLYTTYREVDDSNLTLAQFDLESSAIAASKFIVDNSSNNLFALQLAPNNKIYCATAYQESLGVIGNPDNLGILCNFVAAGQPLAPGKRVRLGLPPFITSFFNASFNFQNICFGTPTIFTVNSNQTVTNVLWSFGDGSTSTEINPVHLYNDPGTYTVTCSVTGVGGTTTSSRVITIFDVPTSFVVPNQFVCGTANSATDLSIFSPTILGSQAPAEFAVSYFSSATDALNNSNVLDLNYSLPLGNTTLFASVYNIANPQCKIVLDFVIVKHSQPVANQPTDFVICENLPYDGVEQFDLQQKHQEILGAQNPADYSISYHGSLADADNNNLPLPLLYSNGLPDEIIYSRIQNNDNTNCYAVSQFNLKVVSRPIANPVSDFEVCDDAANDEVATFDLSEKTVEILGGQSASDFVVRYYYSLADAHNGINEITTAINNTENNQTIYATISAIDSNECSIDVLFHLVVNPMPVVNNLPDQYICDENNDGFGNFSLHSYDAIVLGTQNSGFDVTYHLNATDASINQNPLAAQYQNITNPQTVFIRVQATENPACFNITSMIIGLHTRGVATQVPDLVTCDDETNDNFELFDLSSQDVIILGAQSAIDFNITYYLSELSALAGTEPLPTNYTNTSNPQTIYARITNNLMQTCFDITDFQLIVRAKPRVELNDEYWMCEGQPILVQAPTGFSTYNWSDGSDSPSLSIAQAGHYSLTVTKDYGDIICTFTKAFTVSNSGVAAITKLEINDWTDNENMITVHTSGEGTYEYSLDGVQYQNSNQFFGLQSGTYTVYVRDVRECGITTAETVLLMYPKFFTPNDDGYNDRWKIKFSEEEPDLKVMIYDRYGKLIIIYSGLDFGWDGNLNGSMLPSSDYWFVVTRENGKNLYGHFTLKR